MKNLDGIKAIIFDLGGVILNIDYQRTVDEFKKIGVPHFGEIFSQFKQSSFTDDFEKGRISENDFYETVKAKTEVDFSFSEFRAAWNAMLLDLPPQRIEMLKKLSEQYRLFLFSNTNETHYNKFITKVESDFDILFEKTYYSHQFGLRKPDKFAFQMLLEQNNLVAEDTLFIDDSYQHIESANSLGIRTLLIQEKPFFELLDLK